MSASTRPAEARRNVTSRVATSHPQLRVLDGKRRERLEVVSATAARRHVHPLVRMVAAVSFLLLSLVGSLMLRTQMVQDSFEVTRLQTSIGVLTQDVQDDQTKLDTLDSALPEKAEKLGMKPQSSSVSLDVSQYLKDHPQVTQTR